MFPHRPSTRARLAHVAERLRAAIHPERATVDELEIAAAPGRISHAQARELEYRPAAFGTDLGPLFATHWLRVASTVPESWAGSRVDLIVRTGGEATLWIGRRLIQGLNSGGRQPRPDATLVERAAGGERVECELELASNDPFGYGETGEGALARFELEACELARFDADAWRRFHDFEVLRELELEPDLEPAWAGELLAGLNDFCNTGDEAILTALLARRAQEGGHEVSAVGHAHLDTAWLWPLEETERKALRTFSTQLRLLDEYPGYVFAVSQAQQLAWVKARDPGMWGELVKRDGFHGVGGCWVEPDTNLPAGESLARQLIYGQRFFERELGRRCTELWLPDTFGYSGQLPQLMRLAGMTRMMTQKLSWNAFNPPEHHTLQWEGIDGSAVLVHFPPADTYNAEATVAEVQESVRRFRDHERSRDSLLVFGYGDGGGGPTRAMLERLRRMRDLRGMPRVELRTPEAFFDRVEATSRDLRTVTGELYFEYHRGTYTTPGADQARQPPRRGRAARRRVPVGAGDPPGRRGVSARGAARPVGGAADLPVPRHPAREPRSPRSTSARAATWTTSTPRRARLRSTPSPRWGASGPRSRSAPRRSRGSRWSRASRGRCPPTAPAGGPPRSRSPRSGGPTARPCCRTSTCAR